MLCQPPWGHLRLETCPAAESVPENSTRRPVITHPSHAVSFRSIAQCASLTAVTTGSRFCTCAIATCVALMTIA